MLDEIFGNDTRVRVFPIARKSARNTKRERNRASRESKITAAEEGVEGTVHDFGGSG